MSISVRANCLGAAALLVVVFLMVGPGHAALTFSVAGVTGSESTFSGNATTYETADTLQTLRLAGKLTITGPQGSAWNPGNGPIQANFCDASATTDPGQTWPLADGVTHTLDFTFNDPADLAGCSLQNLSVFVHDHEVSRSTYDFDVFYSTVDQPGTFTKIATACNWTAGNPGDPPGQKVSLNLTQANLTSVQTVRFVFRPMYWTMSSWIDEIDLNVAPPLVGDINRDGYVNVGDLQALVAAWGSQQVPLADNWNPSADLNNDGFVNVGDLQLLVANWGATDVDTTAPAAVTSLAAGNPTVSSLTLTWTAPGDDGNTGTATSYDIRYSTSVITEGNWASATQVTGEPAPTAAGTNQNMVVGGLSAGTTYYFAIMTTDEAGNVSALSNVASGATLAIDTTAPAAVVDLVTSDPTSNTITLTWTAPGDDGSTGTATSYDIRYRTDGEVNEGNWASATQVGAEPAPGPAGTSQSLVVGGLPASTTCHFAMKTSDEAPNWSALSNVASGTTQAGTPSNKALLTPRDFKYLGYYELPWTLVGGNPTGFTHRYVDSQLRFLAGTWILVEFAPPASLGGTVTALTNSWSDIWTGTGLQLAGAWSGLWYEQAANRLWTTWALDYPSVEEAMYTKSLAVRTLNSNGTISNVAGPWGLQGIQQRRIYGGVTAVPSWFQSTYGVGPYAVGWGGYASRAASGIGWVSLGPTFYTFPEPTSYPAGDIPTTAFKTLMDHSDATAWADWYSNGFPTDRDRGVRNADLQNEYDVLWWQAPAPDGLGRWVWADSNWNTGCWIETATKHAFITAPQLASGRNWYETSRLNCERTTAEIQVFNPYMLGEVALGTRASWNTYPTYRWQITDLMLPLGFGTGGGDAYGPTGGVNGTTYDATTQRLYVYCAGDYHRNSYILVYEIGNANAPVEDVAIAETALTGTVSGFGTGVTGLPGNRANTETADSVYEKVTEVVQGNTSQLEHKWTFNVTAGSSVVFKLKSFKTSNSEGDDFVFAYSTNGTTWTNMVTVSRTTDDGTFQTYTMPGGTSGTVYVRVQDTDRTVGNNNLDIIYVDRMFFLSNP